jgi:Flp pilus assembly protein TadD
MMTIKGNVKLTIIMLIGFAFIFSFTTGCTSTKNLLGYFKFWGPKKELAQEQEAGKIKSLMSRVRPARGNPDSHYLLATHYQQRGRHRDAVEEFRKVVLIDPHHVKAYNGMGVSYDNLREFEKAQESYRTALSLAPAEDYLYNNLGYSLALKGEYAEAVEVLEKSVGLNPENEQIHNNLAMAYAGLGNSHRALAELERTEDPAHARFTLAQILQQQGRLEDAETFFTVAASLDPSLARKMPEKDRFIAKVSKSLKESRQAGAGQRKDQPAKMVKKAPARSPITIVATKREVPRRAEALEPDFLVNKVVRVSSKGYQDGSQKKPEAPASELMRNLFPIRYAAGSVTQDSLAGKQWF